MVSHKLPKRDNEQEAGGLVIRGWGLEVRGELREWRMGGIVQGLIFILHWTLVTVKLRRDYGEPQVAVV